MSDSDCFQIELAQWAEYGEQMHRYFELFVRPICEDAAEQAGAK